MEDNASSGTPVPPPPPVSPPPPPPPAPAPTPAYAFTPPPPLAPAASPARRRGRGWMVFSVILLVLLVFSVLLNLGSLVSGLSHGKGRVTRTVGPKLDEVLTEDNDSQNKIAVIEING